MRTIENSLVRIRTADGSVVGAGFLVGKRQILTCAHVVTQALGLIDDATNPPQAVVSLDFPLIPPCTLLTSRVILWYPLRPDASGDIAGLELQSDPPAEATVAHLTVVEDVWQHPFRALGFPAGHDDGIWATGRLLGRQATNWILIENVESRDFAVAPGFSGTPLWDMQIEGVVGMVVASNRLADLKAAFVIPTEVLVSAWPLISPNTYQHISSSTSSLHTPIKIFYCYARKDKILRDELEKHLEVLRRLGQITTWYDREIQPGKEWKREIDTHLNTSDIVLLLVSPNFMRSDYCYGVEMHRALERYKAGEAHVIPIILRPVDWKETSIGELQALPTDGQPITKWRNRDEAFRDVVRGVRDVVRTLLIQMQKT